MSRIVLLILALWTIPGWASAQSVQDAIVAQLAQQGFADVTVSRTLLGRTRIVAISSSFYREIVLNPVTGEILRDYWRPLDTMIGSIPVLLDPSDDGSHSGSGADGSGDGGSDSDGSDNGGSDDGGSDDGGDSDKSNDDGGKDD